MFIYFSRYVSFESAKLRACLLTCYCYFHTFISVWLMRCTTQNTNIKCLINFKKECVLCAFACLACKRNLPTYVLTFPCAYILSNDIFYANICFWSNSERIKFFASLI